MTDVTFVGWRRPEVARTGTTSGGGRLTATLTLHAKISQLDGASSTPPGSVPLELLGPGDVAGLAPGTIRTVMPLPGAVGFETTHYPYVELTPADLPWRYTPIANKNGGAGPASPWLVLVVGVEDDGELTVLPDGRAWLSPALTKDYDLGSSTAWAHIQRDDAGIELGRILSTRPLAQRSRYTAALVAAFDAAGGAAWSAGQDATVACFYRWSFSTADDKLDFTAMAVALEPQAPDALGVVAVRYRADPALPIPVRGALTTPKPSPAADGGLDPAVAADLASRRAVGSLAVRPPVLGMPTYGDLWADPAAPDPVWLDELNTDPRQRVPAGLGALCGVLEQELLLDSARTRWGAIGPIAQRIRGLVLGLAASGSLWRRRLPVAPERRLLLYGPSLAGMVAEGDRTVLELLTGPARPFARAFFSGAARRAMRPATGRRPRTGGFDDAALVTEANQCPPKPSEPSGLPDDAGLGRQLQQQGRGDGRAFTDLVRGGQLGGEGIDRGSLGEFVRKIPSGFRQECVPVDVDGLVGRLDAAVDPTTLDAPARRRVLGPLVGLDEPVLAPPEPCVDLDVPAWRFLRDHAKRWLLPGAEQLAPDRATGLKTNAVFVDAFLVGLNQQFVGELRWRNLPVRSGCTPVRRFWDLIHHETDVAHDDIIGVAAWPTSSSLGDHLPAGVPGAELVVALRTPLFRRYPDTLIYLVHVGPDRFADVKDNPGEPAVADRVAPVFVGEVERDLPFFGFPVDPSNAKNFWVVIEQVPHGYQFGNPNLNNPDDGGAFARERFISPVRVFLSGEALLGSSP